MCVTNRQAADRLLKRVGELARELATSRGNGRKMQDKNVTVNRLRWNVQAEAFSLSFETETFVDSKS